MHQVIAVITYAKTESEAFGKAQKIFEELAGDDKIFDYYVTFDQDQPLAGKNRWGNLPVAARADSVEGKKLIDQLMGFTKKEFMDHMSMLRKALAVVSDEELFAGQLAAPTEVLNALSPETDKLITNPDMVRFLMESAGRSKGPNIFLYDQDGDGIITPRHLNDVLTKWAELYKDKPDEVPYQGLDIWVIPADVHY